VNIGIIRERGAFETRVAVTPHVVRQLVEAGHRAWVETQAGEGAKFADAEYIAAGAEIGYSPAQVIQRSDLLAKIVTPSAVELAFCPPGIAVMAFFHMAVADHKVQDVLLERGLTAIGCEVIRRDDGRLPVLAAASEIAGKMTVPIASHLLRSSSGGRGILLGGSPGVRPAHIVILGAGAVGTAAAYTAVASGASVSAFDTDPRRLRRLLELVPGVEAHLAERESIAEAVRSADVLIGAVLVAGSRAPHVVTRAMVESMNPGAAIIDVAIDQGGCVETSRPTTLAAPTFEYHGVTHFCVPNITADMGRSTSVAIAEALLPYLLLLGKHGIEEAMRVAPDVARGIYTHRGSCVSTALAEVWQA
jgi:alanine dehydrogenase